MKTLIAISTILVLTLTSISQNTWLVTFNSSGNNPDVAKHHAVDNQGNTYVTGYTAINSYPIGFLMKINPTGNIQWVKNFYGYNGSGNAIGQKVMIDQNNNVYVCAAGTSFGNSWDFFLHKYDNNGNKVFSIRYGEPNYQENFGDAFIDISGNVIVAVQSRTSSDSLYNMNLLKYNSSGIVSGFQSYSFPLNDVSPCQLLQDNNGNIFAFTNLTNRNQVPHSFIVVLKYNSQFQLLGTTSFNGPPNTRTLFGYAQLMLNTDIVLCISNPQLTGESNLAVIKLNNLMYPIWYKNYDLVSGKSEYPTGMKINNNNDILIASNTISGADILTTRLDIDGNLIWSRIYDRAGYYDQVSQIGFDSFGNVYCAGTSSTSAQNMDALILKYDVNGNLQFVYNYNGLAFSVDGFSAMTVSTAGVITASGSTYTSSNNVDELTVRLEGNFTGLSNTNENIPEKFSLQQNFPNPFNPSTSICFSLPADSKVKLVVFNSAGQEVAELVNEEMNAGTYEYQFDAGSLSSGVYFYKLITENFTDTKKMMLVK